MKAIIFGASGQDGFYLAQLLQTKNIEAICVSRSGGEAVGDVADRAFVDGLIKTHRPEYVFHLAANSTTQHDAQFENHATISTGTLNILEAVYRHAPETKVFLSGSAMQFENDGTPIDEHTPFAPLSPYAVSRIQSIYAGRYYRSLGLKVYVGYFFNHDSHLRKPNHLNQKIAMAAKSGTEIEIGDITIKKEFNFAGDVINAVWSLVYQDVVFEAVIGSGEVHSVEKWLDLCFTLVNKNWRYYVTIKQDFEPEYSVLVSNPALIRSLGWRAKVDITALAGLMMKDQ